MQSDTHAIHILNSMNVAALPTYVGENPNKEVTIGRQISQLPLNGKTDIRIAPNVGIRVNTNSYNDVFSAKVDIIDYSGNKVKTVPVSPSKGNEEYETFNDVMALYTLINDILAQNGTTY